MKRADPILRQIEQYLRRTGVSATAFGVAALNDPALVNDLRNGRELRSTTRERVLAYIERESCPA